MAPPKIPLITKWPGLKSRIGDAVNLFIVTAKSADSVNQIIHQSDDFIGVSSVGTIPVEFACWYGAGALASSGASASCYCRAEDVRVLAVVEPKLELIQIERQVFAADVVIRPDHAALQQRPEVVDVGRMHLAAHVLAGAVVHGVVLVAAGPQIAVAGVVVGRDQIDLFAYRLAHEAVERARVGVLDHLADHVAFAADRADDRRLVAARPALAAAFAGVAVLVLAAHVGFVDLDDAHQLPKLRVSHPGAKPMAHIKGRAVGAGTDHAMDLQRADAFLAGQHEVKNLEPNQQLVIRILENRPADDAEAVILAGLAEPVKGPRFERVNFVVAAARTAHAVRPTPGCEKGFARRLVRKHPVEIGQRHLSRDFRFGRRNLAVHA